MTKTLRVPDYLGHILKAIERTDPAFAALHDDIPWQVMYTMRNRVSHGYDKVDLEIVWKTIPRDLPRLYQQVQALAAQVSIKLSPPGPRSTDPGAGPAP